jgi:hypothetical protein
MSQSIESNAIPSVLEEGGPEGPTSDVNSNDPKTYVRRLSDYIQENNKTIVRSLSGYFRSNSIVKQLSIREPAKEPEKKIHWLFRCCF